MYSIFQISNRMHFSLLKMDFGQFSGPLSRLYAIAVLPAQKTAVVGGVTQPTETPSLITKFDPEHITSPLNVEAPSFCEHSKDTLQKFIRFHLDLDIS